MSWRTGVSLFRVPTWMPLAAGACVLVLTGCARHRQAEAAPAASHGAPAQAAGIQDAADDAPSLDALLAKVDAGAPTPDECRRLAYHEWNRPDVARDQVGSRVERLVKVADRCGAMALDGDALGHNMDLEVQRARLIVQAADMEAQAQAQAQTQTQVQAQSPQAPFQTSLPQATPSSAGMSAAPDAMLTRLVARVDEILQDPAMSARVADALRGLSDEFFAAVAQMQPQRVLLWRGRYASTMESMARDSQVPVADQLDALYAKLRVDKALDPRHELAPGLVVDVQQRIQAALAQSLDDSTRSRILHTAQKIQALGDVPQPRH